MGPLLRSRRQCFYCGQRSTKPNQQDKRRWQCENCEAVNHLDEHGEITEPPAHEVNSSLETTQRYARPASQGIADSTLFCSTCLKNQQIATHLLASYLPPSDSDLQDGKLTAQYPTYRKELEDRYPQVCRECEPRVRERIRQTGYEAKTDHLRRLMERSRRHRIAHRWGWRNLLVKAGGLGQLLSLAGHLCWAMSVIVSGLVHSEAQIGHPDNGNLVTCLHSLAVVRHTPTECSNLFYTAAGWALFLASVTIWWNPLWHDKLEGREGRLRGLTRYYRLQALALVLRFGVWLVSQEYRTSVPKALWALQVVASPILVALSVFSLLAVHVDPAPVVSWQIDVPCLVSTDDASSTNPFMVPPATSNPEDPWQKTGSTNPSLFPIPSLASKNSGYRESSPVPTWTGSDSDAMEWEPSQNFWTTPYADRYPPQKIPEPSPFYGRLPPAPTNHFKHKNPDQAPPIRDSIGLAPGHFDKTGFPSIPPPQSDPATFAAPKFFPAKDHETDTGLEAIFGKVFSLGDDPLATMTTTQAPSSNQDPTVYDQSENRNSPEMTRWRAVHLISASMVAVCLLTWILMDSFDMHIQPIKLGIITIVGGISAVLLVSNPNVFRKSGDVLFYLSEIVFAAVLATHRYQNGYLDGGRIDHVVTALLALMMWQEIYTSAASPPSPISTLTSAGQQQGPASPNDNSGTRPTNSNPSNSLHLQNNHSIQDLPAPISLFPTLQSHSQPPSHPSFLSTQRPRTNSTDSATSNSSDDATSIASTVTSSTFQNSRMNSTRQKSPGFGLGMGMGSLALNDGWGGRSQGGEREVYRVGDRRSRI